MPVPYNQWRYFCPPRTNVKIPFGSPVQNAWARMSDAVGQFKLNGSRNIVAIDPDDNIQFWNRHREQQRNYVVTAELREQIRALAYPKGRWNLFDSELMHFKTPDVKNTVYLFDTLVWGGEHLIGVDYATRFALVQQLTDKYFPLDSAPLSNRLFIANNFKAVEWTAAWNAAQSAKSIEGLVLKRTGPVSRLTDGGLSEYNNGGFMCRIRKPFKNSQF
jgi:hypothetical protein